MLSTALALGAMATLAAEPLIDRSMPNVVFVFTDDQDWVLGSMEAMPNTRRLIMEEGTTMTNAFATTPICCPSRAEVQTGRYMHNTKVFGNACGGTDWQDGPEKFNVGWYAQQQGYATLYAGKYLNNYGSAAVGGVAHVPRGWNQWLGLVGNSKYWNYSISNNGVEEKHGHDYSVDYYTDLVANQSLAFLKNATDNALPFFMMLGTPASHGNNDPAPQYEQSYAGRTAPRSASWNKAPQPDKHWLLRSVQPMDANHINVSDVYYQRRFSVLRSVDDLVVRLMAALEQSQQLDNTYILYSSDHGYHLGQFGMIYDKRMPYDSDTRVPLFLRGPNVPKNMTLPNLVGHIDIAPTILDMMGIKTPANMDGRSWLPLLSSPSTEWRDTLLVEYSSDGHAPMGHALSEEEWELVHFPHTAINTAAVPCSADASDSMSIVGACSCTRKLPDGTIADTSPCDIVNNTYACVRTMQDSVNSLYCQFDDDDNFVEYYDLALDPWSVTNLASSTSAAELKRLSAMLDSYRRCEGEGCFNPMPSSV